MLWIFQASLWKRIPFQTKIVRQHDTHSGWCHECHVAESEEVRQKKTACVSIHGLRSYHLETSHTETRTHTHRTHARTYTGHTHARTHTDTQTHAHWHTNACTHTGHTYAPTPGTCMHPHRTHARTHTYTRTHTGHTHAHRTQHARTYTGHTHTHTPDTRTHTHRTHARTILPWVATSVGSVLGLVNEKGIRIKRKK